MTEKTNKKGEVNIVTPSEKTNLSETIARSILTQEEAIAILKKKIDELKTSDKQCSVTGGELKQALTDLYNEAASVQRPLDEMVDEILRAQGFEKQYHGKIIIDYAKASRLTKLNQDVFRKSIRNPNANIDMSIVMSICIGLKLSAVLTDRLLQSAGLAFRLDNPEHLAYIFLLEYCKDFDIDQCNQLLKDLGIRKERLLGSHGREKDGSTMEYTRKK